MRRPHGGHVMGASPQIPFANDLTARPGDIICPQDQLLDLRMIQSWYQSGALKGGLWLPDWAYQEQLAGTPVTATGQPVGVWAPAASTYSATQTTTPNKPLTAITPVTSRPWLNADSTDVLPVVFPTSLGSACTIARATPTGVTFDEAQTISATWNNLIQPYQYNSAVLVADRQLTAREKAIVSRVLGAYVPGLGRELAANPNFEMSLDGWLENGANANNTATWENGACRFISDGVAPHALYQFSRTTVGTQVYLSAKANTLTGAIGLSQPLIASSPIMRLTSGSEVRFAGVAAYTGVSLWYYTASNALIDYFSVKEIL